MLRLVWAYFWLLLFEGALRKWLVPGLSSALLIVRDLRPDRFFPAESRRRLDDLMARWKAARDAGAGLPAEEQAELERLAEDEVRAAGERAAEVWRELAR